jgi:hypothetical protein
MMYSKLTLATLCSEMVSFCSCCKHCAAVDSFPFLLLLLLLVLVLSLVVNFCNTLSSVLPLPASLFVGIIGIGSGPKRVGLGSAGALSVP